MQSDVNFPLVLCKPTSQIIQPKFNQCKRFVLHPHFSFIYLTISILGSSIIFGLSLKYTLRFVPSTLGEESLQYAQKHLWITCFLYGLLRPMDGIVPYRMEHCVTLEATNDKPINQFWKDKLTDVLIHSVKADDGILIHLSTAEYEHLFDWKRICREVKVIQPLFYVRQKDDRLKMQAVWAKSCRGAMVKYILSNQLATPEELAAFSYEGFEYAPELGEVAFPHFVRNITK